LLDEFPQSRQLLRRLKNWTSTKITEWSAERSVSQAAEIAARNLLERKPQPETNLTFSETSIDDAESGVGRVRREPAARITEMR